MLAIFTEERSAFVLHFDSPSFMEWPGARLGLPARCLKTENPRHDKFALRAKASMTELDEEDISVQSRFHFATVLCTSP